MPAVDDHGHTDADVFLSDLIEGLGAQSKSIPTKYLYDERGSELFDQICELDAYYPTRTEASIFDEALPEIAELVGERAFVIEPGAGNGVKTVRLLRSLSDPVAVAVVDISMTYAEGAAQILSDRLDGVEVLSVCADFTQDHDVPDPAEKPSRRVVFFPGSTVGNFTPEERHRLLRAFRRTAGERGALLMGFDLKKDRETLELAYDDPEGVTAEFNLNVLRRANREVGTDFDLDQWEHRATWNPERGRVELEVVSQAAQTVTIGKHSFEIEEGEAIYTESSHKFTIDGFGTELATLGFRVDRVWTDDANKFAVALATGV
ncbi:MAG: L-histidine N(alpha)-methyltransferase [Planctomycetota bacterium]